MHPPATSIGAGQDPSVVLTGPAASATACAPSGVRCHSRQYLGSPIVSGGSCLCCGVLLPAASCRTSGGSWHAWACMLSLPARAGKQTCNTQQSSLRNQHCAATPAPAQTVPGGNDVSLCESQHPVRPSGRKAPTAIKVLILVASWSALLAHSLQALGTVIIAVPSSAHTQLHGQRINSNISVLRPSPHSADNAPAVTPDRSRCCRAHVLASTPPTLTPGLHTHHPPPASKALGDGREAVPAA
jgi:hypothetical protein